MQKAVAESCWEKEEAGEVFQFPQDATLPSLQKPLITGCKQIQNTQIQIKGREKNFELNLNCNLNQNLI